VPKFRGVYKDAKGAWYFKASTHKDPLTGKWAQVTRRGFATAASRERIELQTLALVQNLHLRPPDETLRAIISSHR
jgi:hypothetical protein